MMPELTTVVMCMSILLLLTGFSTAFCIRRLWHLARVTLK